ncbi:MAG: hypothetical protein KBC83_02285 [Candidatus Moranbacteria bacterium]|jgi:hypothetical protein|nr:hypothetical protein [Candidatus Moranbacteria bacterium]MBP9801475.1 hypothetical protein [Candidatus Moranbacteria bacterium]
MSISVTEFKERVVNSPVLSDAMKQALREESTSLNENEILSLERMLCSIEQAVGIGAEAFLDAYQRGDTATLLQK